jgi:hypothetical protein
MWACLMQHERRKREDRERAIDFLRVSKRKDISKVYGVKAISYGKKIEVIDYGRVRVTFKKNEHRKERSKEGKRKTSSIYRARTAIYRLVEGNIRQHGEYMPVFLTLTFRENVCDLRRANGLFKLYIKRMNYRFNLRLKYLVVPEFQKRGAVHFHVIFFNMPYIDKNELENTWNYGMTNVQGLRKVRNVSAYVAKYLSKETFDNRLFGEKAYFCSRGLKRPIETYGIAEVDKVLQSAVLLGSTTKINRHSKVTIYEVRTPI